MQLARRYPVTRQAIEQQIAKRPAQETAPSPAQETAPPTLYPELAGNPKATPKRLALILESASEGLTKTAAAAVGGIHVDSLTAWLANSEAFQAAYNAAQASYVRDRQREITRAGARDWRASQAALAAHPMTRSDHGGSGDGKTLNVQINVRSNVDDDCDSLTIEG